MSGRKHSSIIELPLWRTRYWRRSSIPANWAFEGRTLDLHILSQDPLSIHPSLRLPLGSNDVKTATASIHVVDALTGFLLLSFWLFIETSQIVQAASTAFWETCTDMVTKSSSPSTSSIDSYIAIHVCQSHFILYTFEKATALFGTGFATGCHPSD